MQVVKGHEGAGATRKRGLRALPGKIRRAPAFLVKLAHMARFAAQAWKLSRRVAPFQIFDAADCAAELAGAGLPWPGTDTVAIEVGVEKRLKIFPPCSVVDQSLTPGQISTADGHLTIGCGSGALRLESVQPDGGRRMSAADYLRGRKPTAFER